MKKTLCILALIVSGNCVAKVDDFKVAIIAKKYLKQNEKVVEKIYADCGSPKKPGVVENDLNGDGVSDLTFLFEQKKDEYKRRLVVLFGLKDGGFKKIFEEEFDANTTAWPQILGDVAPRFLRESEGPRKYKMKNHGVEIDKCEAWSWVMFWNEEKNEIDFITTAI